jgi:undecaprenyl diphosphate synthase
MKTIADQVRHVGIIMDGNGRWAQLRGKSRSIGHIRGAQVARKIIQAASDMGLAHLTLYAFSTENWLRPLSEVNFLMKLLRRSLEKEREKIIKNRIRFEAIGELNRLPEDLRSSVLSLMRETRNNEGMHLVFAMSYGARWEIVEACRHIAEKIKAGELEVSDISEKIFSYHLQSPGTPDPDLIIRTSGENRLSNFLLWQAAYSELVFTPTNWPDFSAQEFSSCVGTFSQRERRFGGLRETAQNLG